MQAYSRPLTLGLSVGHPGGSGGSIGPFVRLAANGAIAFLSTTSVLAPKDAARRDMIHQPGPFDQEVLTGRTRAGMLSHVVAPDLKQTNRVDVAVATLLAGV